MHLWSSNLKSFESNNKIEDSIEVQSSCFVKFPDKCKGCPEYREMKRGQVLLFPSWKALFEPVYGEKVVKECRRYHQRKVEYPRINLPDL